MTDTFLEYEASREDSEPIELYAITTTTGQAYYLTSAIRDIPHDGRVYRAAAIDRGEVGQDSNSDARTMKLMLAVDHPLVRRWTTYASPPKRTTVVCYRQQHGVTEEWWEGQVTGLSWSGAISELTVPARMSDALKRKLPNVSCSKRCTHILYDVNCGVSKTGSSPAGVNHQLTTTVISINGRDIRVDLATTTRNGGWAKNGTIRHSSTGETMTVVDQVDVAPGVNGLATLTMQGRVLEMKVGDQVVIQRGCKHEVTSCFVDFNNVQRFGGYPHLPIANPFKSRRFT